MGLKLPCVLLLTAALLAGCAGAPSKGGSQPPPDQSPPAAVSEPEAPAGPVLVDDPDSPYPMAVERWTVDMDGDGPYHAEGADEGIVLRQYLYGTAHVDGMGDLVTTLSWKGGQPVVLDQRFEWYY
ncbi:hypothetical protein D7V91_07265 [bacterium 1xD42-67]|nr:hypothetical protein D7V91_07265 [bacterium 1xD42-67]